MFFTIIAICINLLVDTYIITKWYLCSLEYIPYEKGYFFSELNKDGVLFTPFHVYIVMTLLLFFMIDFYFMGTYFIMSEDAFVLNKTFYSSKIALIIVSFILARGTSGFFLLVILDGLAHIRKFKLNRKKNN